MSEREPPRQQDMFNGEWVDARTEAEKRRAARQERQAEKEAALPPPLFPGRETIQFGVTNANPTLPFAPPSALIGLKLEDTRTQEEIEQDAQREAEAMTEKLFSDESPCPNGELPDEDAVLYLIAQALKLPYSLF